MIRLNDVTKVHQRGPTEVHALRGVTCEIPPASLTFIVGPSGSGKSTLLHLIGALDEPTTGEITCDERRVEQFSQSDRDEYRRNKIGFIFQNFNLLSNLNSIDNVLVPFMPSGVTTDMKNRAIELLKEVGMDERLTHRPSQLSGGEQQRVAIARALLKRPSIVLADEPTGELDSKNGAEIFSYLRRLCDDDEATVIVVTHDRSYITEEDRVLTLRDGVVAD